MRKLALLILLLTTTACERERRPDFNAVPVRLEVVKSSDFAPTLTLLGAVRAARTIPVEAVQGGTLVYSRRFAGGLQTGVRVTRGEVIAELRNDAVRFDREQARLRMEAANAQFELARRSFDQGLMSSAEFNQAKLQADLARTQHAASTTQSARLTIVAPESGTLVVTKPIAGGVDVAARTLIAEIASGGAPIIECSVAAGDRASLRPGLAAKFAGDGRARIAEVAGVIDTTGTARVVATIESGAIPPPGTGVELQVELDRRSDVLTVPEEAIVAASEGPAVFVASSSAEGFRSFWRVKRIPVELGGRSGGRVEVTSGLRDGERVVVSGADALSDDAIVSDAEGEAK
jgi:RND family efflux transporter MFP subunit